MARPHRQACRLAPDVKHTCQESGAELCTASILLTSSLGGSERIWGRRKTSREAAGAEGWAVGSGCPPTNWGGVTRGGLPLVSKWRLLVHRGGYFYGPVNCFGHTQPLHDSRPIMSMTGAIAGSSTEDALVDNRNTV